MVRRSIIAIAGLVTVACTHPAATATPQATPQVRPAPSASVEPARNASVSWAFTQHGDHPDVQLADDIARGTTEVDATIYSFNRTNIVQALVAAESRCHCVRLIADADESKQKAQIAALQQVQAAGVPIKIDAHSGIMHMKVIEVDRTTVDEGSFNWTNAASTTNDEILVSVRSADFATAFAAEFDAMWNDQQRFHEWQPPAGVVPLPPRPEF